MPISSPSGSIMYEQVLQIHVMMELCTSGLESFPMPYACSDYFSSPTESYSDGTGRTENSARKPRLNHGVRRRKLE